MKPDLGIERYSFKGSAEYFEVKEALPEEGIKLQKYLENSFQDFRYMIAMPEELKKDGKYQSDYINAHRFSFNSILLVAMYHEEIIGVLNFVGGTKKRVFHDGEMGVSVSSEFSGRGVGSALLGYLLRWAQKNPIVERVTLFVMNDNKAAINLYYSMGFQVEGIRRKSVKFGENNYQDLIMMAKFIDHQR